MRKSVKNIIANFVSKTWGFIALYLFSKFYLNILGIELYGVISFYALIFGVVSFADAGFSSSLSREFAKSGEDIYLLRLLRFFEKVYFGICIAAGLIVWLFAKQIANQWLGNNTIPRGMLENFIKLMGIGVATQLMSTIYFGALMGRQMQVWANGAQLILSIAKTFGGVAILFLFHKNLYAFFIWQALCNVIYLFFLRSHLVASLNVSTEVKPLKISQISVELWKYLGGMTLIAILTSLSIQSDKIVTSRYFSLTDFGYYSLASILSQLPVLVVVPIAMAIFPVLIKNNATSNKARLYYTYRTVTFAISIIIFPIGIVLAFYGSDIFDIWLSAKNVTTAPETLSMVILMLSIGNTFQALQTLPYYFLLAKGKTKFTIWQASFELLIIIPSLLFFVKNYGFGAVGIPWMIIKVIGYFYLVYVVNNLKPGEQEMNYKKTIVIPAFSALVSGAFFYFIFRGYHELFYKVVCSMLISIFSILTSVYFYDKSILKVSTVKRLMKKG